MTYENFKFESKIYIWAPEKGSWHFIALPTEVAHEINNLFGDLKKKWGSLPVVAKIGKSEWKTSIFPDSKKSSFILPVKVDIRKREALVDGDLVSVQLRLSRS